MKNILLATVCALMAGCAGYQIGPVQPTYMEGIKTLAVPTFRNETFEPRIEVLLADSLIKQIQQDGTYQVTREGTADAIVEGKIVDITRRQARSVRGNTAATKEFELRLRVAYTVTKRDTGKVLRQGEVLGTTSFFVSSDLQQDERQAIPLAAEDAAVDLVSLLSEGW